MRLSPPRFSALLLNSYPTSDRQAPYMYSLEFIPPTPRLTADTVTVEGVVVGHNKAVGTLSEKLADRPDVSAWRSMDETGAVRHRTTPLPFGDEPPFDNTAGEAFDRTLPPLAAVALRSVLADNSLGKRLGRHKGLYEQHRAVVQHQLAHGVTPIWTTQPIGRGLGREHTSLAGQLNAPPLSQSIRIAVAGMHPNWPKPAQQAVAAALITRQRTLEGLMWLHPHSLLILSGRLAERVLGAVDGWQSTGRR